MRNHTPSPAPAHTEDLELDVQSLSHDGRAVCRHGQRVIFVRGGLPGQRVLARILRSKKNFAEGVCQSVLTPAPDALAAPCPHARLCGGCPLQEMPAATQLHWKERILRDALARIGKISDAPVEPILPSPRAWGYRNKMEFAFGPGVPPTSLALGLREGGSHAVCDIRNCLLLPRGGMEVLHRVRQLATASGLPAWEDVQPLDGEGTVRSSTGGRGFWRFAVLRMPEAPLALGGGRQLLVTCITAPGDAEARRAVRQLGETLLADALGVTGFVHEERHSAGLLAQGEKLVCTLGRTELHERLGGVDFAVDHAGFFQVNTAAAEHLCQLARDMAEPGPSDILWDLYCGVGAPGLCLAAGVRALHGVEYAPRAVDMARRNAAAAGLAHCRYQAGDVRRHMGRLPRPDTVLLDPPRAGLHPDVIKGLLRAAPRRMVYISCNPATLARDIALLAPAYTLARVAPVDLFPQTPHVESVSLLLPT